MRELSLFFFLFSSFLANELHDHSLKHVQKRNDIPLEFIWNSKEHSDIRRSVRLEKEPVERISSDKFVIRRDDPSSTEVVGDSKTIPDKFDQPSYDFMLPEGQSETSTILAVVDFITQKHSSQPKFAVTFDENRWFDIGEVVKTSADNADVYKATVILKPGVDVAIQKTNGGVYKFSVEAQQGDVVLATTMITVEVLSLAPTTKRSRVTVARVTVPMEPKTMATEASEAVTSPEEEASTPSLEDSSEDLTSSTTLSSEDPTSPEPLGASTSSPEAREESEDLTSSTMSSEGPTSPEPESSASESSEPLILGGSSEESTSPSMMSSDAPTSPEPSEAVTSSSNTPEASTPSEASTMSSEDPEASTPSEELLDGSGDLEGSAIPTSTSPEPSDASGDDSSSELLTSSEESPIDGPVTILPLRASEDGKLEPLDVSLEVDDVIRIPLGAREGDLIRDCHVALGGKKLDMDVDVELSIEPEGGITVRPNMVKGAEQAMLFVGDEHVESVEIVAKYGDVILRRHLKIQRDSEGTSSELENSKKALKLREMTIEISEDLESGRTIGSLEEPMRILNSDDEKFSLINGMDIILSCSAENCLKINPQKTFTLILMPLDGSLRPLQVNIRILEPPTLRTSDDVIRVSDNKIITEFVVITERSNQSIILGGSASKFLATRSPAHNGLYQLIISNSIPPEGHYSLDISLPGGPRVTVPVHVSNSLGHAHFREKEYRVTVDARKMEVERELVHLELEGVPIDEARIMVLDGNPGWVTVEGYGGKVKIAKFDGPIYTGKSQIRIGAVDKKTWTILTETLLEVDVINGEVKVEEKTSESRSRYLEATFDREKETNFELKLEDDGLKLDPKSIFGIDEKGRKVQVEPMSVAVSQRLLKLTPESLKTLRTLSFSLTSPTAKYSVLIRLISSPEYLETQRKIAARPIYPEPWTREDTVIHVEMNEELREGQVIGVFPAVSGDSGASESGTPSELSGDMSDAFTFDPNTGELKIRQRIDYESLSDGQKSFDLKLTSGEPGFESVAVLRIKVIDVDDNSPVISTGDLETISIPENLPAGTKIAELDVTDSDGSPSYTVALEGSGSQNYVANISDSGTLSIFVADSAKIDRETESSQLLLVRVSDVSGNSDRALLPIRILDVNDNAPEFTKKMYEVEVVEDWPAGMVIDKLTARDADQGTVVKYSTPSDMVTVNSTSGMVTVAGDLWGKARDVPYKIDVIAEDSGAPTMTSSAILSLRVRAKEDVLVKSRVEFVEPRNGGGEVVVKENTPLDTKIMTVKAETRGLPSKTHGIITYTLKDLINSDKEPDFAIDKSSGDIFAVKNLDYEKRNEYTVGLGNFKF